jgi:protein-S-isoprenylcysteine O-methyltransferase Ste14
MEIMYLILRGVMIIFLLFWMISEAVINFKNRNTEKLQAGLFDTLLLPITAIAFYTNIQHLQGILGIILFPPQFLISCMGIIIAISGMGFIIGAKVYRRCNWSLVTQIDKQPVIYSGPYRLVRHPVYTGSFFCMSGLFLMYPQIGGLFGIIGLTVFYLRKISLVEDLLCKRFGAEYKTYMQKTYRIIPWVK